MEREQTDAAEREELQRIVYLRVPESLHARLVERAAAEATSLNRYCIAALESRQQAEH